MYHVENLKEKISVLTSNERAPMEDEDLDLWAKLNYSLHSFIRQTGAATHVHLLHTVDSSHDRCEQGLTTAMTGVNRA